MSRSQRTLQEFRTPLPPAEVLERAKQFFAKRNGIYSAFVEQEGPTHVTFRGQGGEEIALAAVAKDGATLVTGSTYMFEMQLSRFFTTLPAALGSPVEVDLAPVPEVTA
ncbi:MAG TPA: hypothetical protein VFT96_06005 [Gemmatimonadaceae bacterium]|nr:hypothetical protein [Gemmatimonadaceae bacterium]